VYGQHKENRVFKIRVVETFFVVVLAISSAVVDAKMDGMPGLSFVAFAALVGVASGVCGLFGRVSMAHFNSALTLGFAITRHMTKKTTFPYVAAWVTGALRASLFVKAVVGTEVNLVANSPNPLYFGLWQRCWLSPC